MIRSYCFTGIEAEGPHRGMQTLFVPGSASPETLRRAYEKVRLLHVYYGAGNVRQIRADTLQALAEIQGLLTIEVDTVNENLVDLASCRAGLLVVSLNPLDLGKAAYYKFLTPDAIVWYSSPCDVYSTPIDDPLFAQDKEIK